MIYAFIRSSISYKRAKDDGGAGVPYPTVDKQSVVFEKGKGKAVSLHPTYSTNGDLVIFSPGQVIDLLI